MTIKFNLNYQTTFGEELLLNVKVTTEDGQEKTAVFGMSTTDGRHWQYTLDKIDTPSTPYIDYFFSLSNAGKELRREWITVTHRLDLNMSGATNIIVNNRWNEIPHDSYLYTSAYTECINRHPRHSVGRSAYSRTVRLIVRAPQLRLGERLAIVGEHPSLGAWNTGHAIPMHEHNYNEWQIDLNANALGVPQPAKKNAEAAPMRSIEYKFVAVSTDGNVMWETCDNRKLKLDAMEAGDVCVIEEDQSFFAMCNRRLAGTLVPLFSLRTEGSFGVGDFGDLAAMTDLVADTGQRVLQLLPINDTTTSRRWTDSYPYSCISIFALNPIYVDLRQLPPLADAKKQAEFEALRQELNALPAVDYERVIRAKSSTCTSCSSRRASAPCVQLRSRSSSATTSAGSCHTHSTAICATLMAQPTSIPGPVIVNGLKPNVDNCRIRALRHTRSLPSSTMCSLCSTSRCVSHTNTLWLAA